jgi:UDP-N-acetylmuramoyl-L-alanyl-D-glutamate--2,6-diaminopimelate ligase
MPEQPRASALRPKQVPAQSVGGLIERLPGARLHGDAGTAVTGITHDSRQVQPGDLYLARAGERTHGISFLDDALAAGAAAVLTDPASVDSAVAAGSAAVVEVPDPRVVTGPAAAWVYGDPSHDLVVIGLTGTNGKTTTAYLVEAGLRAAGRRTGLVGTIESVVDGTAMPSLRTTPEATDLQALFALMRERAVTDVAMEVSSHALALDRVDGTTFAVAGFTNLSQDHLDFHADMDDYFAAKARLFTPALSRRGVVAVDDEWGRRLARDAGIPVTTVGRSDADWTLGEATVTEAGGSLVVRGPDGAEHRLDVRLPGRFNLDNAALAFVVLIEAGVAAADATRGIAQLATVPGRMERVDGGQQFTVVVDYAHTPAAVGELLAEARAMAAGGRVVVVLGCGGDRDAGKRPLMGAAAATGADLAVLTNDNPRSEDPQVILDAMLAGARGAATAAEVVVEPDRRRAIERAVAAAGAGDVVVVAGKGHEQGQEQDGVVLPFDDRDVVRDALAARGHAGAGVRPA